MRSLLLALLLTSAQDDGGVSYDNHGQELLESLDIPPIPNAPFSLQLATDWVRPMANGGRFTVANSRPIKRDSSGRIYQERWLLAPKGSAIVSSISWIQIADPHAKTLLECYVPKKQCELEDWRGWNQPAPHPERATSGPLPGGRGTHEHQDLGPQFFAGLPVHGYRETVSINPDVLGNDLPLVTTREMRFSPELAINLSSTIETPRLGRQLFTVTEITTTEPDPAYFRPPAGYQIIDRRKTAQP